jgi:hypothetical protein
MTTPSQRRRQGREAFQPDSDPLDFQPYKKGEFAYAHYLGDWLEGWHEAEVEYKKSLSKKKIPKGKQLSEIHKERHKRLHKNLDELVADYIRHNDSLPSKTSVIDLMVWSFRQTNEPTGED